MFSKPDSQISLANVIKDSKMKRFVTQQNITLNHINITQIGKSLAFKNIIILHLTGNKLTSLDGIEQFTQLKTLQISHNLIDRINELYRIQNPLKLKSLGCSFNPFSCNPYHTTLIMYTFPELQLLDDHKLSFPKRNYFNWVEQMGSLILPAYQILMHLQKQQILDEYKLDNVRDILREIKWESKQYDPSIFAINQLFQHLLHSLYEINIQDNLIIFLRSISDECLNKNNKLEQRQINNLLKDQQSDHSQQIFDSQKSLLIQILHYQTRQKSFDLKNYLMQASLENQDVDLFLFAQNQEYALHSMTESFLDLTPDYHKKIFSDIQQTTSGIPNLQIRLCPVTPYFPLNNAYVFAIIDVFLENMKFLSKQDQKENIPPYVIIDQAVNDGRGSQSSIKNQMQQIPQPIDHEANTLKGRDYSFIASENQKNLQIIDDQKRLLDMATDQLNYLGQMERFRLRMADISQKIIQEISFAFQRIKQVSYYRKQLHIPAKNFIDHIKNIFKSQQMYHKQKAFVAIQKKSQLTKGLNILVNLIISKKQKIIKSLSKYQPTYLRDLNLKEKVFNILKIIRYQKLAALIMLTKKYKKKNLYWMKLYLLRWKIFSNYKKYESQKAIKLHENFHRDSSFPKNSYSTMDNVQSVPVDKSNHSYQQPPQFKIQEATIVCKNLKINKRPRKKSKKANNSLNITMDEQVVIKIHYQNQQKLIIKLFLFQKENIL